LSQVFSLACCIFEQDNGVITMAMIGKVRRLHFRQKKSVREIARLTSLSRNTVQKWLTAPVKGEPKYRRGAMPCKLTAFHEVLKQALKVDGHRPRKQRRTAQALYAEIKADGYTGGYSRVTDFIREWRLAQGAAGSGQAFVPLAFELGEAFQFDWSEEPLVVGGIFYKVQVAHMKLCASRAFWLVAYPGQGHEMLFDAHTRSFAALGGIARRGIYDNMKTAVDKVKKGKGRTVNARFAVMCAHYLFDADFCNVASGWEKGVVEKNVQDSRRRIWIDAAKLRFGSFAELNAWLATRCRALWGEVRHPEHNQFSVAEMLEHERSHLMPMPEAFDGYVEKPSRVSSTCLVAVARNRYSVPCELVGQVVSTRLYPGRVVVVAHDAVVASHERLTMSSQTRYDWQHYIPLLQRKPGALRNGAPFADMPEVLQKLRKALLRHDGGDRLMAQVLAVVPTAGLDAVLVAVALALETGPGAGRVSVEHVINVLGRLNAVPAPESAATTLQVLTPPLANTARYDSLRAAESVEETDHA
jgi:transposase